MSYKRKVTGGLLGVIGFVLSPFSWWNDAVVNFPIAYVGGWIVGCIYRPAFLPAMIATYWFSNILGFVLMQKGAEKVIRKGTSWKYTKRELKRDLLLSFVYTAVILALVYVGFLRLPH